MRLALAASVVALAAAVQPAPHPTRGPSIATVRARVVSGTNQTATAHVAAAAKKYVTDFPGVLVVRVDGAPRAEHTPRHVRFRCVTKGCIFVPADQPNDGQDVDRIDEEAYKAKVLDGKASIRVSIQGDRPQAVYTVTAEPTVRRGERAVSATITLISR
ncbi:MAG: hypothetical protein NVS3B7_20670 [Candidatus Elarobacter sp.]